MVKKASAQRIGLERAVVGYHLCGMVHHPENRRIGAIPCCSGAVCYLEAVRGWPRWAARWRLPARTNVRVTVEAVEAGNSQIVGRCAGESTQNVVCTEMVVVPDVAASAHLEGVAMMHIRKVLCNVPVVAIPNTRTRLLSVDVDRIGNNL